MTHNDTAAVIGCPKFYGSLRGSEVSEIQSVQVRVPSRFSRTSWQLSNKSTIRPPSAPEALAITTMSTTPTIEEQGERCNESQCSSTVTAPVSPFLHSPAMRTPRVEVLPSAMMSPPRLVRCVYYTDSVENAFERTSIHKLDQSAEMLNERSRASSWTS
jgi:hypothetical protein